MLTGLVDLIYKDIIRNNILLYMGILLVHYCNTVSLFPLFPNNNNNDTTDDDGKSGRSNNNNKFRTLYRNKHIYTGCWYPFSVDIINRYIYIFACRLVQSQSNEQAKPATKSLCWSSIQHRKKMTLIKV